MTENPPDAPPEPARAPRTLREEIRDLLALRAELRARQAARNLRLYPNAARGARIAGVPVASLPPELQRPADTEGESDD